MAADPGRNQRMRCTENHCRRLLELIQHNQYLTYPELKEESINHGSILYKFKGRMYAYFEILKSRGDIDEVYDGTSYRWVANTKI